MALFLAQTIKGAERLFEGALSWGCLTLPSLAPWDVCLKSALSGEGEGWLSLPGAVPCEIWGTDRFSKDAALGRRLLPGGALGSQLQGVEKPAVLRPWPSRAASLALHPSWSWLPSNSPHVLIVLSQCYGGRELLLVVVVVCRDFPTDEHC